MPNHMSGKDVKFTFRQNNTPKVINTQTIDLNEVAEEYVDQVNGEDRGRPGIITDYFEVTVKAYVPDLVALDAALEDIANEDSRVAPLKKTCGVQFRKHDGTRAAYVLSEVTRSPFQLSSGGRKERAMQTLKFRARFLKSVQAA